MGMREGGGRLYITLHYHHPDDFALRWAMVSAILMFS